MNLGIGYQETINDLSRLMTILQSNEDFVCDMTALIYIYISVDNNLLTSENPTDQSGVALVLLPMKMTNDNSEIHKFISSTEAAKAYDTLKIIC